MLSSLRTGVVVSTLVTLAQFVTADEPATIFPKGIYFGETVPGKEAKIFAPGIFSRPGCLDGGFAMTSDGKFLCFSRKQSAGDRSRLYFCEYRGDRWSQPHRIPGQPEGKNWLFPTCSQNYETKVFFTEGPPGNQKVACKGEKGWEIKDLPDPSNVRIEWGITHTTDQRGFFGGPISDVNHDLFYAMRSPDGYGKAIRLPNAINSEAHETRPYVSPEGDFLIFESNRAGAEPDLYVSFFLSELKVPEWTPAIPLGPEVNTDDLEDGPTVSADGKHLFFRRYTRDELGQPVSNIHWVNMSVVYDLDPRPSLPRK